MVGDGHAMGVSAEILEYVVGTTEGWFGVDDPVFSEQWSEPGSEDLGLREQSQIAGEVQLVMLKSRLETGDELAAKHTSEYLDGEKEARTGSNPESVIERESTGGNNAVNMGMKLELLVPGRSTLKKPISAPRCLGLRATSRSVSALARSNKP
jgi:hypothetical protein